MRRSLLKPLQSPHVASIDATAGTRSACDAVGADGGPLSAVEGAISGKAQRRALDEMGERLRGDMGRLSEGLRGDLTRVATTQAGIDRQMKQQSEALAEHCGGYACDAADER